jgi:hypothetical protein
MGCLYVPLGALDEDLDVVAGEGVETMQAGSGSAGEVSGSVGVGGRRPGVALPGRLCSDDGIRLRAQSLDEPPLHPVETDLGVDLELLELGNADGAELGRRDPCGECIPVVHLMDHADGVSNSWPSAS